MAVEIPQEFKIGDAQSELSDYKFHSEPDEEMISSLTEDFSTSKKLGTLTPIIYS